ncbi:RNase_T domain-containing protein [Cephalotus follicularis]|uniref:RNase_T domain-containing protein n=1 Tax=Cephalotus follicularis TaxID=3775 RepID=A0A1Q3CGS5_CEPFO|nr:RNase_T domain-containing protein [Cephalotus follicularis]
MWDAWPVRISFFYSSRLLMRTVPMCISILQFPRGRFCSLANFYWENYHGLSGSGGHNSSFKLLSSQNYGLKGRHSKGWSRRTVSTKTEGRSKTTQGGKLTDIKNEFLDGAISTSATINLNRTEIIDFPKVQLCDIQHNITEMKDLASVMTVIVFDIETTGLSRENERIIEIALQDLLGGNNSTFQTLVNPERYVPNAHVHGITTNMVCRPDIPRMEDLIPILLQYVESRQKPEGFILWVAHNARTFDVPFLIKEFSRCSYEIPPNWLFVDTLSLARELIKSGGTGSKIPSRTSLQALREHYRIPLIGSAHRALSDVNTLSLILQRLTFDLKLALSGLVERSFTASDLINLKKKKKNAS